MGLRRSVVWLDGDGMGMVSGEEMGLGIGRRRVKEGEGQGQEVELVEGVDCGVFPSLRGVYQCLRGPVGSSTLDLVAGVSARASAVHAGRDLPKAQLFQSELSFDLRKC
jgi:hypothetical protein